MVTLWWPGRTPVGAVGVDHGVGQIVLGQPLHLVEQRAGGFDVHLLVGAMAQDLVPAQEFEEVELDVAAVALVVAHLTNPLRRPSRPDCAGPVGE